jgi:uncharacterized membrane protein YfcA
MLEPLQYLLGGGSGAVVGFTLGLVGGGGSILAVPLLVYLVGVNSPHVAIGTSAFAVAVNAASGMFSHAREGTVKWRCGVMYAAAGIIGALAGSTVGKDIDGQKLLALFALVMVIVGVSMLAAAVIRGTREQSAPSRKRRRCWASGSGPDSSPASSESAADSSSCQVSSGLRACRSSMRSALHSWRSRRLA